jgi:thioredoxin 1
MISHENQIILGGLAKHEKALLVFSAPWCQPCQKMKPIIEILRSKGVPLHVFEVESNPDMAGMFRIRSVPAFIRLNKGAPEASSFGEMSQGTLEKWMGVKS